ncbi:MAG: prolyl-tRNA synthetase associated domain-containing protein [Magnetovibrio sp.]|nr:prolyl-tRNA synthetase associated domain-containing protein [Magnetovibrio sp.]
MSDKPAKTPQQLLEALAEMQITTTTTAHEAVKTVAQNQALRGSISGLHSKNLFLKDKKGHQWLVVAHEERTIDLKALRKRLGAQTLSFGKPQLLFESLGVEPGSVSPFSIINDGQRRVQVVLDKIFTTADQANFHPLINTQTTAISGVDLLKFFAHLDHPPLIIDFDCADITPVENT